MNLLSKMPLYVKIYNDISAKIENKELMPGERLPSEHELGEIYGISRSTVRQAIQELSNSGLVEKIHGKGTFVSEPKIQLDISGFISFKAEMDKNKINHSTKIYSYKIINPDIKISNKLKLYANEPVYFIKRLRYLENNPVMLETSYIPIKYIPNLNYEELEKRSIYEIFKENNLTGIEGQEIYEPCIINDDEKKLLEINTKSVVPGILLKRALKRNGDMVEYTVALLKPGKLDLKVDIHV